MPLTTQQAFAFAGTNVELVNRSRVTVVDTTKNLTDLTAAQIATLRLRGFVGLDSDKAAWSLTVDEFSELGTMLLGSGGPVTITGQGVKLAALDMQALRSKGVDVLDAVDNAITLSKAQFAALGSVALTAADTVTLADTGAGIAAADFAALAAKGIDVLDATDNAITLTTARMAALLASPLTLAAGDTAST